MSDFLIVWAHVLGLAVYFGSGVTLLVVLLPMAAQIADSPGKQRVLASVLKYHDPLTIGSLGVALMTGAFGLTAYKANPGLKFFTPEGYLSAFGSLLALKLLLVFLLINVSAAVSMGMGHRIVRTELRGESIEPERLTKLLKRMQVFTIVALALTSWIVWISLDMTRLARLVAALG